MQTTPAQNAKRVAYTNRLDGRRRVLSGQLTADEAAAVAKAWGDPRRTYYYLGPVEIEDCDGTPDGGVIAQAQP
jgi:hypothetical protein